MHIAMFTNNYKPFVGGVPISIDIFATKFREMGHQVTIFAPEYKKITKDEKNIFRVPSLKMIKHGNNYLPIPLSGLSNLKKKFANLDIDLVHCHHPFLLGKVGRRLGRKYGLPVVYTYHTRYKEYCHYLPSGMDKLFGSALDKMVENFCNKVDLIFAPTQGMTDYLRNIDVKTGIEVIPTGINLAEYERVKVDEDYKQKLGIDDREDILLFVGRLATEKNIDFLIKALQPVLNDKDDLKLLMTGDGPKKEKLIEMTKELEINNQVKFLGRKDREELIKLYKLADLFTFSSLTETQGMVITEALAGKTPVIALDGTGIRDIISNGEDGYLLKPGDKQGFAKKVTKLLVDEELRQEMSENAWKKANQYGISKLAKDVLNYYYKLCNSNTNQHSEAVPG